MQLLDVDHRLTEPGPREAMSPMGLAAMVAFLHVAVLAARVSTRHAHHHPTPVLSWPAMANSQPDVVVKAGKTPSNPVQTYCVGRLDLTRGMAVVVLAEWLHIMRTGGVHSH
jgi:hypothetical protein